MKLTQSQRIMWWGIRFAFLGYGVFICWNFVQGGTSLLESMGVTSFLLGPLAFVLGMVVRFLMGRVKLKRTERIGGFLVALFCSLLQGFFAWMSCFFCATVIEMEPDSLKDTLTFYGCFLSAVIMLAHAVVTVVGVSISRIRGMVLKKIN